MKERVRVCVRKKVCGSERERVGRRAWNAPAIFGVLIYRGTSLIRTPPPIGPYSSPVPRDLWCS